MERSRPKRRPRAMLGMTRRRRRCSVRKRDEREEPWLTSQFQHRTQLQCRSWLLFRKLHLCLACPCFCACDEQAVCVGPIQKVLKKKKKNTQHNNQSTNLLQHLTVAELFSDCTAPFWSARITCRNEPQKSARAELFLQYFWS